MGGISKGKTKQRNQLQPPRAINTKLIKLNYLEEAVSLDHEHLIYLTSSKNNRQVRFYSPLETPEFDVVSAMKPQNQKQVSKTNHKIQIS